MTQKSSKLVPFHEAALILAGELVVSAIVCLVYILINRFSYKVLTGVALGSIVTTLNFLFLAISTNHAFDRALDARGDKEMDEEEADRFAEEHKKELNNAIKLSFIIRNATMLATLVIAFVLDWFDVIATLVPLLMLRPIITVEALIREKGRKDS